MEIVDNACNYVVKDNALKNSINYNETKQVKFLPSVEQLLRNIIAKEGFKSYIIHQRMISNNASSYLGDLYEVDIKGESEDGLKEIYLFLKHIICDGILSSFVNIKTCYAHEVLFYTDLSNMFNKLQDEANVPKGERFKFAKTYGCTSEVIILENLVKKGFKTLNRMDVMPLEFAELSITQLAKLHGLYFLLKLSKNEYFEKIIKKVTSSVSFDGNDAWKKMSSTAVKMTTAHLDINIQKKIDYFLQNSFYDKFPKYSRGDNDCVKIICHGDFRISNVMTKQSNEEESEVVLIDFQFLHYRSPVIDLLYFFYTGTDREFRKVHMNNLRNLYHDKLAEFLRYFDKDVNDVYPKEIYEKEFVELLDFGLMVALYVSTIIFPIEDQVLDIHKESFDHVTIKLDDRCKKRINEVIEEYTEWGIL